MEPALSFHSARPGAAPPGAVPRPYARRRLPVFWAEIEVWAKANLVSHVSDSRLEAVAVAEPDGQRNYLPYDQ